jgi:signal transduction histidine kinase
LFDLLVCGGVVGLTAETIFARQTPHATMSLGYVMAGAVFVRRRWPLSAMAIIGSTALLQVILFPPRDDPLPYDLAVLIGMYSVVKYARRMLGAWLAAATVATGIVIEVQRHGRPNNWWALAIWYVGVCGGVWLMAYTMRERRLYVTSLEERAVTLEREREHLAQIAVARERAAIARELHDAVAHSLAVMIVQADGGRYAIESDPGQARSALETVASTGREALADMRRLVGVLRGAGDGEPPDPPDDRRAITMDGLGVLVDGARSAGLDVAVAITGDRPDLAPAVELAAYRIVQESLTNVLRHAGRRAKVTLSIGYQPNEVTLSITNDGGQRLGPLTISTTGNGLVGMRERVSVHNGEFHAGPRLDGGWSVTAVLPLAAA